MLVTETQENFSFSLPRFTFCCLQNLQAPREAYNPRYWLACRYSHCQAKTLWQDHQSRSYSRTSRG